MNLIDYGQSPPIQTHKIRRVKDMENKERTDPIGWTDWVWTFLGNKGWAIGGNTREGIG